MGCRPTKTSRVDGSVSLDSQCDEADCAALASACLADVNVCLMLSPTLTWHYLTESPLGAFHIGILRRNLRTYRAPQLLSERRNSLCSPGRVVIIWDENLVCPAFVRPG